MFSHHSARVNFRATNPTSSVLEVVYTGVLCRDSFDYLVAPVVRALDGEQSFVARMDTVVELLDGTPPVPVNAYRPGGPAGAVVVRPDQYQLWSVYVAQVRELGLRRAIFLPDEIDLARRWAIRHRYLDLARSEFSAPAP